jgi:hypothetical protein
MVCGALLLEGQWICLGVFASWFITYPFWFLGAHPVLRALERPGVAVGCYWRGWWQLFATHGMIDDAWCERYAELLQRPGNGLGGFVAKYCLLTDRSMKVIGRLRDLRHCKIPGARITDAGVAELARLPKLEVLDLRDTDVTDAVFGHLRGAPRHLQLFVGGTRVTQRGIQRFRSQRPDVYVSLQEGDVE